MLFFMLFATTLHGAKKIPPRPKFNKEPYKKTVWSQANPWFPPNLSRTHNSRVAGPDYSWWNLSKDPRIMWKQVAEKIKPYGLTGLQLEVYVFDDGRPGFLNVFKTMADGFKDAGNKFFVQPWLCRPAPTVELTIKGLEEFMLLMKNHPNVYRLNGAPVISVYRPTKLNPEEWFEVIKTLEARHGRMIWLLNSLWFNDNMDNLKNYLRVFDGITQYGILKSHLKHFKELVKIRKDFPEKIWELVVHNNHFVHFHGGGVPTILTKKIRKEWESVFDFKPDAVAITNFFDISEYSRIFPSYEAEDILMRISHNYISKWRKKEYICRRSK